MEEAAVPIMLVRKIALRPTMALNMYDTLGPTGLSVSHIQLIL